MVKPNISEGVKRLALTAFQKLEDEILKELIPNVILAVKIMARESPYECNQAKRDTSLEYEEFELSYDEYAEIFNELMRLRRATHCFDVVQKILTTPIHSRREESLVHLVFSNPRMVKCLKG